MGNGRQPPGISILHVKPGSIYEIQIAFLSPTADLRYGKINRQSSQVLDFSRQAINLELATDRSVMCPSIGEDGRIATSPGEEEEGAGLVVE